jgi:hypothetical protein
MLCEGIENQSAATLEWARGLSPPLTVARTQDRLLGGAPIPLTSPPWDDYDAGEPLQAYRCQSRGRDYFSLKPDCSLSLSLLTIQVKNTSSPRPGENDWIPYLREPRPNRLPIMDLAGGDPCTGNWKEKKGPDRYIPHTWSHLSIKLLDIRKLQNRKWFLEQKLQAYSTEARRSVADRHRDKKGEEERRADIADAPSSQLAAELKRRNQLSVASWIRDFKKKTERHGR